MELKIETIETDVLVIGGGTAGCFAALTIEENSDLKVLVVEKANIKRSGCLAAGVNALNAYINEGETVDSFVEYVKNEFDGIVREDLVYTIAKRLNSVTKKLEDLGLPILKDENGKYASRGKRSIKINGENIKPILSKAISNKNNINILNNVNIVDYIVKDNSVIGAYGFSTRENIFYVIKSRKTICATGGAAGIYKPNNPGFSRHKMWYSPFNTGAGYAMGIRAGAEMTSFEMRFIALRCKDTIAPTGTVAQGVKVPQVNSKGEKYVSNYKSPKTSTRLYATLVENKEGRGPCFLKTKGITQSEEDQLFKAYLNMAPAQTLKWLEKNSGPLSENIEIEGTEPYIVGGHTSSGYWIDENRKTTLKNLYAVGDVAGGSPKKYVTGCFAEGEIAALSIINNIKNSRFENISEDEINNKKCELERYFENKSSFYSLDSIEDAMQKVMDEYAGGIKTGYAYSESKLNIALDKINEIEKLSKGIGINNMHELLFINEILDRLCICKVLIHHLKARKETRWRCYQENLDYPYIDNEKFKKYINSRYENGQVNIITRDLVRKEEKYEH